MAAPKKLHLKRNVGIAVLVIAIMLIGLVAGFTNDFSTIGIGVSTPTPTPPSGAPLQTPTSTQTPQPNSTSTQTLQTPQTNSTSTSTSTPASSPTPSPLPTPIAYDGTSPSGYYLLFGTNEYFNGNHEGQAGNSSEIFVVSTNASYGYAPYATVTNPNGVLITEHEPCFIINFTIRNDYSTLNPAPNDGEESGSTLVNIKLTAQIFNGENQINSTDITNASPIYSVATNGAFTRLNYGESTSLTIYLATNNTNITSFQIVSEYIGLPLPP